MTSVSERHAVCLETGGHADDLMAHADSKHGLVPFLERLAEMHCSLHAVVRVSRAVAEEETIELVTDIVEVVVPRQDSDSGTTTDKRAKDVRLCAEVEHGDLHVTSGVQLVRRLRGDLGDKVLCRRIPVLLSLGRGKRRVGANGKAAEGRALVPKKGGDGTCVDASDARDVVPLAPRSDRFDGGVVRELLCDVGDHDGAALDVLRLENDTYVLIVDRSLVVGDTVISNEGSGEDKDLTTVGGIGHRLGI